MHYFEIYQKLKELSEQCQQQIVSEQLSISMRKIDFHSSESNPGVCKDNTITCVEHQYIAQVQDKTTPCELAPTLNIQDALVQQNNDFKIIVLQPINQPVSSQAIVMFHGLNEKKWDKYLPWAHSLVQKTNKAVILFPISFHMDRAPLSWSERAVMLPVATQRAHDTQANAHCSYVNAALSHRMQEDPHRLFWSGLQTYNDFCDFTQKIREGQYEFFDSKLEIDLFGYSIGSFLATLLLMANPNGILTKSKVICFCGAMTLDRMYPVSKYIMDAKSTIQMQRVYAELLATDFISAPALEHYLGKHDLHAHTYWFKTMLRYNHFQSEREARFKELEKQIFAINLKHDEVAAPIEALNTMQGPYREIEIPVHILDFPFKYSHVVPFALTSKNASIVDQYFDQTMQMMADFYCAK